MAIIINNAPLAGTDGNGNVVLEIADDGAVQLAGSVTVDDGGEAASAGRVISTDWTNPMGSESTFAANHIYAMDTDRTLSSFNNPNQLQPKFLGILEEPLDEGATGDIVTFGEVQVILGSFDPESDPAPALGTWVFASTGGVVRVTKRSTAGADVFAGCITDTSEWGPGPDDRLITIFFNPCVLADEPANFKIITCVAGPTEDTEEVPQTIPCVGAREGDIYQSAFNFTDMETIVSPEAFAVESDDTIAQTDFGGIGKTVVVTLKRML